MRRSATFDCNVKANISIIFSNNNFILLMVFSWREYYLVLESHPMFYKIVCFLGKRLQRKYTSLALFHSRRFLLALYVFNVWPPHRRCQMLNYKCFIVLNNATKGNNKNIYWMVMVWSLRAWAMSNTSWVCWKN